jgi:hypothetical protein
MNSTHYQICVKERLEPHWQGWFDPLLIQPQANGSTLLVGALRDQAELHGILLKIRNLNLTLVSITPVEPIHSPA